MFRVAAISEYYKFKESDFTEYVVDELVADMTKPEAITINITVDTDEGCGV